MASKTRKNGRATKRRLALPPEWLNAIHQVQDMGAREVEKIYSRVSETDFVKRLQKNEVLKRATKAGVEIKREMEERVGQFGHELESRVKEIRHYIPVPTRSEVDALAKKITQLSKRVDEMSSSKRASAAN